MQHLEWRDRFSRSSWQSGADYVGLGAVTQRRRLGSLLHVRVQGRRDDYTVDLDLAAPESWSCSCASRLPCRHQAAALHAYAEDPTSFYDLTPARDALQVAFPRDLLGVALLGRDLGAEVMAGAAALGGSAAAPAELARGLAETRSPLERGRFFLSAARRLEMLGPERTDLLDAATDALSRDIALDPLQTVDLYLRVAPETLPLLEKALLLTTGDANRRALVQYCLAREMAADVEARWHGDGSARVLARRAADLAGILLYALGEQDVAALTTRELRVARVEALLRAGLPRTALVLALHAGDPDMLLAVWHFALQTADSALALAFGDRILQLDPRRWPELRDAYGSAWPELRPEVERSLESLQAHDDLIDLYLAEGEVQRAAAQAFERPPADTVLWRLTLAAAKRDAHLALQLGNIGAARASGAARSRWLRQVERIRRQTLSPQNPPAQDRREEGTP